MVREIEITRVVEGHKMDVSMRHIDTNNGDTNLDAGANLLESLGNTTAEKVEIDKEIIIKVKDVVYFFFRNAEDMTLDNRIYIEESKEIVGLSNSVARYLASNYA